MIFATHNDHKLSEVLQLLENKIEIVSLSDMGFIDEIPEPFFTLEENAFVKSNTLFEKYQKEVFAEDTGLFIESLNGEPGVFSARYAGEKCTSQDNIEKVLKNLSENENRKAFFKTIICLIKNGETFYFEGKCEGNISLVQSGNKGFGYDPIFIPQGYEKTFADISSEEKNAISHRKKAFDKMKDFLLKK
ncbi:MAG: RdgB/HAM1 family non-canonical purine NTP pyrophosphatase [Chitinophagaceae bacterium]|nr:RdgB/HAM1 family non-canonical purine NTP pyrophosphatase [Chitinophagaceae bacterium]